MKFINYLESLSGVSIYGLASLIIFVSFFLLMFTWSLRAEKRLMDEMSHMPLEDEAVKS